MLTAWLECKGVRELLTMQRSAAHCISTCMDPDVGASDSRAGVASYYSDLNQFGNFKAAFKLSLECTSFLSKRIKRDMKYAL